MRGKSFLVGMCAVIFLWPALGHAQFDPTECRDSMYCTAGLEGMLPSKFVNARLEYVTGFGIESFADSGIVSNDEGRIRNNKRMEYNLKFPMFDSPGFKMAGGLSYYTEEFNFRASDTVGNGMYQNLNDRDLRSLGFALYALKPFRSQYFLGARAGVQWNGDFERVRDDLDTDRNFLKWTAAAVFGKKPRDWTEFGFGAAISYDFGRPSIYPVLFYNHNFNQRWGFESLLPVNAKIRYNYGPQTIFHLAADLQGTSFHVRIADSVLRDINTLEMRKSEIRWQLVWNQAIKDPLWFSVAAGYRRNFTFKLAESNDPRGNIIYRNSVSGAFFFNIELYIVPPDELIDKWRRKRALKKLEK